MQRQLDQFKGQWIGVRIRRPSWMERLPSSASVTAAGVATVRGSPERSTMKLRMKSPPAGAVIVAIQTVTGRVVETARSSGRANDQLVTPVGERTVDEVENQRRFRKE